MVSQPRLRSLLRQAEKVASAGKRKAAEKLYRQIVGEAPESVDAWLGLATITDDEKVKQEAYQQVQSLDARNEEAANGLARLRGEPAKQRLSPDANGEEKVDPFDQSRDWLEQATAKVEDQIENSAKPEAVVSVMNEEPEVQPQQREEEGNDDAAYDLFCYRHPGRETSLRCYSCGRAICSECAVKTPVGYRCPICIREAEEVFYNARTSDYILAPMVSLPLSVVAGYLVLLFGGGFGFFVLIILFVGGAVGGLIGRAAKRIVGHRRGRYLPHVVAATVVLGVVIPALPILIQLLLGNSGFLGSLIMPAIYLLVATGAAFYQMK